MGDIGLDGSRFVDRKGRNVDYMFKLYRGMDVRRSFGRSPAMLETRFVEPPWKMILSKQGCVGSAVGDAPDIPISCPAISRTIRRRRRWESGTPASPVFPRGRGCRAA